MSFRRVLDEYIVAFNVQERVLFGTINTDSQMRDSEFTHLREISVALFVVVLIYQIGLEKIVSDF